MCICRCIYHVGAVIIGALLIWYYTQWNETGAWDPYPITMSFEPPCMVLSTIGLEQPGKVQRGVRADQCSRHLHQLHVCLPAKEGHTRLLYRMSLDFIPWARHLPGIQKASVL